MGDESEVSSSEIAKCMLPTDTDSLWTQQIDAIFENKFSYHDTGANSTHYIDTNIHQMYYFTKLRAQEASSFVRSKQKNLIEYSEKVLAHLTDNTVYAASQNSTYWFVLLMSTHRGSARLAFSAATICAILSAFSVYLVIGKRRSCNRNFRLPSLIHSFSDSLPALRSARVASFSSFTARRI